MADTGVALIQDRRIMVTRPVQQSDHLCDLLESAGGRVTPLPAINIVPVEDSVHAHGMALLDQSHIIIFISRNAVRFFAEIFADVPGLLAGRKIYAIGAGTRAELINQGVTRVEYAASGTGSEALLALESLRPDRVAGRIVVIVRGVGGREYLKVTLQGYGGEVHYLEVYERQLPVYDPREISAIWRQSRPDAIVISSMEGLQNLVEMTGRKDRNILLSTPLVVISNRIADYAATRGFTGPIGVADDPGDAGIMRALVGIFEES